MRRVIVLGLTLTSCWLTTVGWQRNETAERLLGKALHQEEVEGNLQAAIATYQEITSSASTDRVTAARAQFRIGACYEKLGKAEAQKAYELVLQNFADQPEFARAARARLAALRASGSQRPGMTGVAEAGPVMSEVKLPSAQDRYALSPDGMQIAFTNRSQNLAIRNLTTGQEKKLTNAQSGMAFGPVWSPDGQKLAYSSFLNTFSGRLRIVSVTGGGDQDLQVEGIPMDWSKDGRFLLYVEGGWQKTRWSISLLPLGGGGPRELLSGEAPPRPPQSAKISPDNRYIAYAIRDNRSSRILVLPMEGGEATTIAEGHGNDSDPVWTPDGNMVIFVSDRNLGRFDLWGVPVLDGKPAGKPVVVKPDSGRAQLLSLNNSGRLLMVIQDWNSEVYLAEIDSATRQPSRSPVRLTGNGADRPTWSPDGKRIAYTAAGRLHVIGADGSNDQEVAAADILKGPYAWAPDNDTIYFAEQRPNTGTGIYSLSVSAKEIKPVLLDQTIGGHVACSPDGKRLAFAKVTRPSLNIFVVDVDGKNLRQVTSETSEKAAYPAWSPDGKRLAYYKWGGPDRNYLMVANLDDNTQDVVASGPCGEAARRAGTVNATYWFITWSPDGTTLTWSSIVPTLPGEASSMEIQSLQLGVDDKPHRLAVDLGSGTNVTAYDPKWAPDGRKLAFTAATSTYHVLLVDNFLPVQDR